MCVLLPSGETRNYINIRKERSRLWDRSHDYVLVSRSMLYNCQMESGLTYLLKSIAFCEDASTEYTMSFALNLAFLYMIQELWPGNFSMCKQPFSNYANDLPSANCFFLFLCRMLLALFAGFLVPSCPKLALVLGNVCERLCVLRSLLGSYIHQESI